MNVHESLRMALRALRANALRSLLTMLGIIIGVAAVIVMLAVGAGARLQIEQQLRSLGSNLLQIVPRAPASGGVRGAGGAGHTLTDRDATAITREVRSVAVAAPAVRRRARLVHDGRNWVTTINGTTPAYFVAREWRVAAGRSFSLSEVDASAKVAVIGSTVAQELFPGADAIGGRIRVDRVPFTVVGVLADKGASGSGRDQDDIVFVPVTTAQRRLAGGAHPVSRRAVAYILVKARSAAELTDAERSIRALLRQRHDLRRRSPDDFDIRDPAAVMQAQHEASRILSLLLGAVAAISLLVGGISIMNIMLVSTTERTREIGLRMAVGAEPRHIRDQFLVESMLMCVAGGALGVLVGIAGAAVVSAVTGWPVFIGPGSVVLAVGFAATVGVCFGYYPARKASRLDAVDALRYE